MPSDAGAPSRRRAPAVETSTSTTIVITYGSAWNSSGGIPVRMPRAWNVNGIAGERTEEIRADEAERRPPEREDDERNRDPAGARREPVDPLGRDREREARAADACERTARHRVRVAIRDHVDPHRVGCVGRLADRPHVEAKARPVQVQRDECDAHPRRVDEHWLLEQDRPDDRRGLPRVRDDRPKEWRAGWSARFRSLPRYDDSPAAPAKIVSASPETIWFARSVTTRNAWIVRHRRPGDRSDEDREQQ